jgi:hypothetical protein
MHRISDVFRKRNPFLKAKSQHPINLKSSETFAIFIGRIFKEIYWILEIRERGLRKSGSF